MIELLKFYRLRFVSQLVRLHPAFLRDAKHVLRLQQQRFRKLIKHAGRASPHYERKFAGINLETCGLTDLPILTKHEMMENFEDVVTDRTLRREDIQKFVEDPCNLGKLFKGKYAVAHTSGSQGRPALIVQDGDAMALDVCGASGARLVTQTPRFSGAPGNHYPAPRLLSKQFLFQLLAARAQAFPQDRMAFGV